MILGDMYDTSCRRRERWMQAILSRRRQEGTLREMRTVERDRCFIDFTSNDYLGLGRSTELLRSIEKEEARVLKETAVRRRSRPRPAESVSVDDSAGQGFKQGPNSSSSIGCSSSGQEVMMVKGIQIDDGEGLFAIVGSGGSRLLSGNSWYAEELEGWIAGFHRRESALLFNSGYDANLGLMSCLPQPGDAVVCDELVHNSVRMGCRLGRQQRTVFFRHNDTEHLDAVLQDLRAAEATNRPRSNIFVAVESVYSMDGDLAPLTEILRVAETHTASVIVDEAHSTGVFGEQGRGLVSALHLESHPALLVGMHSFGKALGVHGAVVVGSATLREFLVNYARPLIYSTSLPLHSLACIRCAYLMQAAADGRRRRIIELAGMFQSLLADDKALDGTLPLDSVDVPRGRSPIQSVVIAGNERSLFVAESLRALGFDARAIRKPTVQEGTERLRITLHAYNTDAEVTALARHIRRLAALAASGRDTRAPDSLTTDAHAPLMERPRDSRPSLGITLAKL